MKLFALFNGCYSDTTLVGIYSTRSRAELAAEVFSDDANIEEYDLDAALEDMLSGRRPWFVRLNRETGDALDAHQLDRSYGAFSTDVGVDVNKNLYTHVWAEDQEHAVKIASERRRMFLALGASKE